MHSTQTLRRIRGVIPLEKGITVAISKVIKTTWLKKDLLAKLRTTLKRMDDEIDAWEKSNKSFKKREDAWEKKAIAWARKNLAKAEDSDIGSSYHGNLSITFRFDQDLLKSAVGERPEQTRRPSYKDTNYNQTVSDYEQVENAIALVDGSKDTEFIINSSSAWAQFIR